MPRTQYCFVGLRDEVGKFVDESLPNIKGTFNATGMDWASTGTSGAFDFNLDGGNNGVVTGLTGYKLASFNAHNSSPTYQDNAHVQQKSTQMYLYFYVGQYSQTAIEQTAGLNAELFNGKLDITSAQAQAPYLKTAYVNGLSGYNIWSNGYCEQWGKNTKNNTTINFIKTFKDINFCFISQPNYGSSNMGWAEILGGNDRDMNTSTYRTTSTQTVGSYVGSWVAIGYLAEGEY